MRYADQHIHCRCSFDCPSSMADMVRGAEAAGLAAVCFTDHMDMSDDKTGARRPSYAERWPAFAARQAERAALPPTSVEVRLGMELGEPCQAEDVAAAAAAEPELDFVIASIHNLPGVPDFHYLEYGSMAECEALNRRYLSELCRTAKLDCFDVMGHIGYTCRYMSAKGCPEKLTADKYGDELRTLLGILIDRGKGIECNASGFRGDGTFPYPDGDVLRLYRELGGEIVTVGSDAHVPGQAGLRFRDVYALLENCGFRYTAEFIKRKPEFISLK